MNKVQAKRVLKLADFLKAVPRKRFSMETWCSGDGLNQCGTTGCAGGWATTMPAFQRLGLNMTETGSVDHVKLEEIFGSEATAIFLLKDDELTGENRKDTPKRVAKILTKRVREAFPELV